MARKDDENFKVEIAGGGVTPTTVDPLELLEFSVRYLDLLRKTAKEYQVSLNFSGVGVESGSARLATAVSDPKAADFAQRQAHKFISGKQVPPPALREPTNAVKKVLREMPPEHSAAVISLNKRVPLIPHDAPAWSPPATITTLRAKLIAVGGKTPKARFSSRFERGGELFAVDVTEEVARKLAAHLYSELEIVIRFKRDEEGKIFDGTLLGSTPVGKGDTLAAWRQWYRENASEWDDVVDIEKELGRD